MPSVLVLNVSYEALCVVSTRRAVGLLMVEKAEMVTGTGRTLHSSRLDLPEPSVVKLTYYVNVPQIRRIALTKKAIFARDHYRCQYCGASAENVDHVVPKSRGGPHSWDNVVAACRSCNSRKRDRLLSETNLILRTEPRAPAGRGWSIAVRGGVRDEWMPYLLEVHFPRIAATG